MPYIHVTLALGRSKEQKRSLILALTDTMERVLEVARVDIHVLLWELPTENIGEAGEEPAAHTTNNALVLMARGRPSEVVLMLIKSLTDAIERSLNVQRRDVHVVITEEPFHNIGESGIPMEPPRIPHWYYNEVGSRHKFNLEQH